MNKKNYYNFSTQHKLIIFAFEILGNNNEKHNYE